MDIVKNKKNQLIKDYRPALITALSATIDELNVYLDATDQLEDKEKAETIKEQFRKSLEIFTTIKIAVEEEKELSDKDVRMLAIALTQRANQLINQAKDMTSAGEQLLEMSKVFFA